MSDARRLKTFEQENARLKHLLDRVDRLANTINDADAIAAALAAQGFEVMKSTDHTRRDMTNALRDFRTRAGTAEIALIWYAGHGIEVGGENYLIPVDALLTDARDVEGETISLSYIANQITGASRLKVIVLDACRDNPFLARKSLQTASRSVTRGLVQADPGLEDMLIPYPAASGVSTFDGPPGGNSPYASAFIEALEGEPLDARLFFSEAGALMREWALGAQPGFKGTHYGRDRIVLNVAGRAAVAVTAPTPIPAVPRPPPPAFTSDDVREAEVLLVTLELLKGTADDFLDPAAEAALRAFQSENGIPATGEPDPITRALLRQAARLASLSADPTPHPTPDSPSVAEPSAVPNSEPMTKPLALVWEKTFGGADWDELFALASLPDGGALAAGSTSGRGAGGLDGWLLRVDSQGDLLWQRSFGGADWDETLALVPLPGGGALAAGATRSSGAGNSDGWLLRIDKEGNLLWLKTLGAASNDELLAFAPLLDGGTLTAGTTRSSGAGS